MAKAFIESKSRESTHVLKFMKSNIKSLTIFNLPVLSTVDDLSLATRLSKDTLYKLSKYSNRFYREFQIPKSDGSLRTISQPSRRLKGLQGWILYNILNKLTSSIHATGFIIGKGLLDNVKPHIRAVELLNMDITDFFTMTKSNKVFDLFRTMGYNHLIANILTKLCTYKGYLPQGGPCSPALANLTNTKLDRRIGKYCSGHGIIYTRYADDMTFSIPILNFSKQVIKVMTTIVNDEGYEIKTKKTRVSSLGARKEVTGLTISENTIGIGKNKKRIIRSKIYNYHMEKVYQKVLNNEIQGWLSFIYGVDKKRYKYFCKYIQNLVESKKDSPLQELRLIPQHDHRTSPSS